MCDHLEAALPSTKSSRANAVHYTPTGPDRGTAIIDQTGKGKIAEYAIVEFHADGGRGFRISNRAGGADAYAVFLPFEELADSGMAFESCDCRGFERFGHCKHIAAIRAIVDRGLIALPTVTPAPATIPMPAPKPVRMCIQCGSRPNDGYGVRCEDCEGRM
ncbi:MAG TPA: hypothetical protein VGI99_00400 [Gemmataceae bacterium]|jgi:hypothetical protein